MRKDQLAALDELSESLMDVFLTEADPSNWSGHGSPPTEMTEKVRGARNWDMKNANQAGALMARALDLRVRLHGAAAPMHEDDAAQADVSRFERQARQLLDRIAEKHAR